MNEMTKKYANYAEYRKEKSAACNALPLFFAFSNEQLERALKERNATTADIYRLGNTGGFYLKKDADIIKAHFLAPNVLPELMKDEDFAVDAFLYEMNDHEYAINWQGDWDVCSVFAPRDLDYEEDKDYTDYLREAGMEYAIKAYQKARRKHMKMAQEWA